MNSLPRIELGDWDTLRDSALAVRHKVFVQEQRVPLELERDEFDPVSCHAVVWNHTAQPVGTGRLLPDGHIGRMALLPTYRSLGWGSLLLHALMQEAQHRGLTELSLNAQVRAQPFYLKHGFEPFGAVFMDAGIEHVAMRRNIAQSHLI